jgi:hypothetical protein
MRSYNKIKGLNLKREKIEEKTNINESCRNRDKKIVNENIIILKNGQRSKKSFFKN